MAQPNILFIMTDDHAAHSMSCYGSKVNTTPNLDRIAAGGIRMDNCFCTNSICTPSRATILAGTYSHVNGATTLDTPMDNTLPTYPKLLQQAGYQTAIFGKWHLGPGPEHCPTGFDDWAVLPGQGRYFEPRFIVKDDNNPGGTPKTVRGYVTDIVTDMSIDWIKNRDESKPFCLMCHHKAPHRWWESDEKHETMYHGEKIPEPETLFDDYSNRAAAAREAMMRVGRDMAPYDLDHQIPYDDLDENELRRWAYQYYIKKYLRTIASVDDNVGRLLDYLDEAGLAENTLVIYTSDQGFFLGDHGWFDKRFMYEESLRMPFVARMPGVIEPGSVSQDMVLNVDFAQTLLDIAGVDQPEHMQGRSFLPVMQGKTPEDWRTGMYYRYWMNGAHHNTAAHYGIRTQRYKLIYYYYDGCGQAGAVDPKGVTKGQHAPSTVVGLEPEWELFDLEKDPKELKNVYDDPAYAEIREELTAELHRLQAECGDEPYVRDNA
jgi:arylsulfatase A-like enzyme